MVGSTTAINPYGGSSAALLGLAGTLMGFPVNPNPAGSHLYSYDRLPTYGPYGLSPQYHPSYPPRTSVAATVLFLHDALAYS
ncbi:hypothetical protein DITRI_Ditri14bG0143900 [Diplodiscus trichospermus]